MMESFERGNLNISNEVISTIANIAASEVAGVTALSSSIADGIVEKLGKKSLSKGIKVDTKDGEVKIDIFLIVSYGVKIPDVAREVQENVKKSIEAMAGLNVTQVNIHVQGINLEKESSSKEEKIDN
ncbi:MAG TPA: Asp23/Gls24 family envelope stress response protein [Eubacteriaceae bacterium]|nr:Asp23/Gls24 family envelope stress response protein [Eubacteriaceae bacterium]